MASLPVGSCKWLDPSSLGVPLGPASGGGAPSVRLFLVLSRFHMLGLPSGIDGNVALGSARAGT